MPFFLIVESNGSGRLSLGPELVNSVLPFTGCSSVPEIEPVDLLKSMLFTFPASTWLTNCEYGRSTFDELPPARLLTMNAAAMSASTIHGTHRSDGEVPPAGGGPPLRGGSRGGAPAR